MTNILTQLRRPDITFYRNGRILISARVARILNLHIGSAINIAVEDNEYLLFARHFTSTVGSFMARCYPTKQSSNTYCANSVTLARALMTSTDPLTHKTSYMVGQPIKHHDLTLLPIITKQPL